MSSAVNAIVAPSGCHATLAARMPSVVIGLRLTAIRCRDRNLRGRARARIRRRIVLAVGLESHPVEGAALESRCMPLLEVGARDFGSRRARQLARLRAPLAVGTCDARGPTPAPTCGVRIRNINGDFETAPRWGAGAALGRAIRPMNTALFTLAFSEYCSRLSSVHRGDATLLPSCVMRRGAADPSAGTTNVSIALVLSSSTRVVSVKATHLPSGAICGSPTDLDLVVILDRQRALRLRNQRRGWKGEGDTGGDGGSHELHGNLSPHTLAPVESRRPVVDLSD